VLGCVTVAFKRVDRLSGALQLQRSVCWFGGLVWPGVEAAGDCVAEQQHSTSSRIAAGAMLVAELQHRLEPLSPVLSESCAH